MHGGKAKWTETSKPGGVFFLSNFIVVIIIIYPSIILFKDPRKRHQLVSACNQKLIQESYSPCVESYDCRTS